MLTFEARESPVSLLWSFDDADPWFTLSRRWAIISGGEALASVLHRDDTPAVSVWVEGGAPAGTVAVAYPDDGLVRWNTSEPTDADTEWVAAHEVGHLLGLEHLWAPGAVLHPVAPREDAGPVVLHGADVAEAERAGWEVRQAGRYELNTAFRWGGWALRWVTP